MGEPGRSLGDADVQQSQGAFVSFGVVLVQIVGKKDRDPPFGVVKTAPKERGSAKMPAVLHGEGALPAVEKAGVGQYVFVSGRLELVAKDSLQHPVFFFA